MKTRFLLPVKFKRAGVIMSLLGFVVWALLQRNIISVKEPRANSIILAVAFFSFLFGLLFLVLSREKTEDEYTQKIRLESFQFAALFQFFLLFSLTILVIFNETRFGKLVFEKLSLLLILLFWIVYFIRFNWILHFSSLMMKKVKHEK